MDENKYPVLKKYWEHLNTNDKDKQNNYSLDNLNVFNNVLYLYFEQYSNNVSREYAEKKVIKDEDIYMNNKKLIDDFFDFYNKLELNIISVNEICSGNLKVNISFSVICWMLISVL